MLIRQDFTDMPPKAYLMQVMDALPKAYCFLWDKKDPDYKIDMTWKYVTKYYNKNAFRTNMRKLNNEGLLSYDESDEGVHIELVGWDAVIDD